MILFEDQRLAIISVWQAKKGQPKSVPNTVRMAFVVGQETKFQLGGNKESGLEITVCFMPGSKPNQHLVEFKLVRGPERKSPATLMVPKLTLTDDKTESVVITEEDGCRIGLNATFSSLNTKNTIEPPAARRAEIACKRSAASSVCW